jgi:cyclopropane fatty-acyl-phospholipid synthase-like methyltransferase
MAEKTDWDIRFEREDYLFGTAPNAFLAQQKDYVKSGMSVLAVADGEGRNGVWLAEQGADVLSVDASRIGLGKASVLAASRGVSLKTEVADFSQWHWPENEFDVVVAIFIQFGGPALRDEMFKGMKRALKSGGVLLMQGYRPEQLGYGTGGPPKVENLYTETLLKDSFDDMNILLLTSHDSVIHEGAGHEGMSALIDLVARKK